MLGTSPLELPRLSMAVTPQVMVAALLVIRAANDGDV